MQGFIESNTCPNMLFVAIRYSLLATGYQDWFYQSLISTSDLFKIIVDYSSVD